jgi:ribosome recycling factor
VASGDVIRIPIPALTEQRRKELAKLVHREGEDAKVAIRNIRRDAIQHLKDLLKEGEVGEDQEKRAAEEVQKMTDKATADIDKLVAEKEKDLMAV